MDGGVFLLVAFIRHGESELNRQGVLDGNSEAGLTEQGILQCMQLGQWIRHNLAEEAVIFVYDTLKLPEKSVRIP